MKNPSAEIRTDVPENIPSLFRLCHYNLGLEISCANKMEIKKIKQREPGRLFQKLILLLVALLRLPLF
jgi:hypothetical protein